MGQDVARLAEPSVTLFPPVAAFIAGGCNPDAF
jgi:hypothetical protein